MESFDTPPAPGSVSSAERITRITATYGALVHEQVELTRRFLGQSEPDPATGEGPLVEEAIRLVQRGAEWLQLQELVDSVQSLREGIGRIGQVTADDRKELVSACHVELETEERLAGALRSEGLGSLLDQADLVEDAIEGMRSEIEPARSQPPRSLFEEGAAGLGPHGNLLALTVEIKSAVSHQNERISSIHDMAGGALHTLLATISEWEQGRKEKPLRSPDADDAEERSLAVYRGLQKSEMEMRSLVYEVNRLLGTQYSLERRARDLDEHLLWEFLDPLDRFVDDLFEAVSRRKGEPALLTVQTGGVGFEPEIGSTLIPILSRLLSTGDVPPATNGVPEVRVAAARESLEAMIAISGFTRLDPEALTMLERALEDLAGFVEVSGEDTISLRIQFPMARALRSFLIVEAAGHKLALPWSAVDRVDANGEVSAEDADMPALALHALFATATARRSAPGEPEKARPVAILRSGGRITRVTFDRIVWRESARWAPLPAQLRTTDEVLGGIVSPDGAITLVLNPATIADRARSREAAA
ncbi:MAG TPA: hypothetical protein VFX78_04240 [Candidatus Eisenbacteria bacterium]|nr:hypothetical protein [Candidatus Eisenbacteria bacterium]